MSAEFFSDGDYEVLLNPGIESVQLISTARSPQARASLTRVTVQPGGVNERHAHEHSEQTWVALSGSGHLLLADGERRAFSAGDVARFPPRTVHGFENSSEAVFEYLTVTAPPVDHTPAYESKR